MALSPNPHIGVLCALMLCILRRSRLNASPIGASATMLRILECLPNMATGYTSAHEHHMEKRRGCMARTGCYVCQRSVHMGTEAR